MESSTQEDWKIILTEQLPFLAKLPDRILSHATDGRSMGELVTDMVIEQPALSRVIDQMERDNLVFRKLASNDNRVVRVFLTATGHRMFKQVRPLELRHYERAIDDFSPSELDSLNRLLTQLWQNLDEART